MPRQSLVGGQSSTRIFLYVVGIVVLAARPARTQVTYTWPDVSTPTFDDAQCIGVGSLLAGVTDYADAQAACEAAGPTICDGLLYVVPSAATSIVSSKSRSVFILPPFP